jgi:hypothetical protein
MDETDSQRKREHWIAYSDESGIHAKSKCYGIASGAKIRSTSIPASWRGPRQLETLEPGPNPARRRSELDPFGARGSGLRQFSDSRQTYLRPSTSASLEHRSSRVRLLRRFPVVEIQETAQSLPARHTPTSRANVLVRNNQLTGKPLMMALVMIMRSELLNGVA